MTTNLLYAGVGSRKVPPDIFKLMVDIGRVAAECGWTLRSGAAAGADTAFETGCDLRQGEKEIFLPWPNFNNHTSMLHTPSPAAKAKAAATHPAWTGLSRAPRLLQSRNMHQVFGQFMIDPVDFLVCWTPDGCESYKTYGRQTGGTGSAISAASRDGIPVYNLANAGRLEAVLTHIITYGVHQNY